MHPTNDHPHRCTHLVGALSLLVGAVVLSPAAHPGGVASDRTQPHTTTGAGPGAPVPEAADHAAWDAWSPDDPAMGRPAIVGAPALPPGPRPSRPAREQRSSPVRTGEEVTRPEIDPLAPLTSPDVGDHCATDLGADGLTGFFSEPIGEFQGADYQRAVRLPDDRVLWTFQDAFIAGALVHNAGMIQSGRCFTRLGTGTRPWLLGELTTHMRRWHWILGGAVDANGSDIHLFVVQMDETGGRYLNRPRATALRRVVLESATLQVIDVVEVIDDHPRGDDLYGWSVTSDGEWTYLYSHCYEQFGHDSPLGVAACSADVRVARVPHGELDAPLEYWDGRRWSGDRMAAVPVVDGSFVFSGNNPAQVQFDGERYLLVEKPDDWWGSSIEVGVADHPQGPFGHLLSVEEPVKCDRRVCNTYFASWVPWRDGRGCTIWSIGHNRWDGSQTHLHLDTYRPTFHTSICDGEAAVGDGDAGRTTPVRSARIGRRGRGMEQVTAIG